MPRRPRITTPLTVPNPAIFEDEVVQETVANQCLDIQTLWSCFPPEGSLVPEEGAWIIVKDVPHTALEFDVPLYSIWRAKPAPPYHREFVLGYRKTIQWPMHRAVIQTPGGELTLYPTEFVTTDLAKWMDMVDEGVTVNYMGIGEPGELAEQVWYMQAHGIPRHQALTLLLADLDDQGFAYLTLDVT